MAKALPVRVVQTGLETSIQSGAKKAGPISLSATVDPSSFKRLAQPLGRVSGLATEFEKSIAASNARVIAFGASVGIINGVQNAFASLVKTTIEVEKSLTNIAVISGKGAEEVQQFGKALFEIARDTAQSFATASEAALEFSRQGLSLDETLKRTKDALTLTRFTTLSAAEAVDVLTAAANSFGETGITTSEILNKLVAVDTKFAVSAEDLAKGLSRAGSIAQEVGVNFDELNAIVTIAQERTARGGAVIGNAFKTIFTRIRSDETIQALQSIGIYSFDAAGKTKPVVAILEELAQKINTLSETKRIEVLEAIASKYNINVLTAVVDDLASTTSKFREARDISAGAQNEAYQRQIELNQTLDAVITRVTNSAAQLADTLGKIGVTENLKSLLNFFDNIITGINDVIDSEGIGGTIAKGLISGLSGVFFKIGIPLLLAIFVKLTRDIAQFGVESLKTILGINKEVRERQALEQAVVNTLIRDQQVMATILSQSADRTKQERYLLSVYNEQLAALQKVQAIAAGVAPALQAAGLSATSGTVRRRAAEGYLPAAEAKDVRRGVGGASPSSKVVEIPNFSFGGGKRGTMVANTSEYIVPNYAGGSGTAIFNKDMAKEYGLPPGAKKITASGGFVPASGFVPNFEKSGLMGIGGFKANQVPIYASASKFTSSKASTGYIPNFVELNDKGIYAGLVGETAPDNKPDFQSITKYVTPSEKGLDVKDTGIKSADSVTFDVYRVPKKNEFKLKSIREALGNTGKNLAIDLAREVTGGALGNNVAEQKLTQTFNPGSLQSFANTIFEASVGALLSDKSFQDYTEQSTTSLFDLNIAGNSLIKKNFGIKDSVNALEVKGASTPKLLNSIAEKIYKVTAGGQDPFAKRTRVYIKAPGRENNRKVATAFYKDGVPYVEKEVGVFAPMREGFDPSKYELLKNPKKDAIYEAGALGYIPNYIDPKKIENLMRNPGTPEEGAAARRALERIEARKSKVDLTAINPEYFEQQKKNYAYYMGLGFTKDASLNALQGVDRARGTSTIDQLPKLRAFKQKNPLLFTQLEAFIKQPNGRPVIEKILKENSSLSFQEPQGSASRGYVPSFADNDPLKEAIRREIGAGVSPARVRVTQDGRLKNRDNPNGLAVINTRDEPNGKIPNDFRERGMRAAMASRGFVPNFAEVVPLRGKLQGNNPNYPYEGDAIADISKQERAKLKKAINDAIAGYEAEVKAGKDATEARRKLAEATKKATDEAKLSEKSRASVERSVEKTASRITPEKPNQKRDIDIGKFLLLQTVVTGLTSAIQSFTEQGSAASNVLEGVNAGLSGTITALTLASSLSPPLRFAIGAITALASASGLIARLYEDSKSQYEKTSESLAKLADQAEKTGKKISPQEFLAAFEQEKKTTEEKAKRKTATSQIEKEFAKRGAFSESDTNIKAVYAALNALDGINKEGVINQDILRQVLRFDYSKGANLSLDATLEAAKTAVTKKQVEDAKKPQVEDRSRERIEAENKLLQIRFNITNSIFDKELRITEVYQNRIRSLNDETAALERVKSIVTETEYVRRQNAIDTQKIQAEASKSQEDSLNNLRTSLSGLSDKGLGNIFGEIDETKVAGLLNAFDPKNINSQGFLSAFQAATVSPENQQGVNFNNILQGDRDKIIEELNGARKRQVQITSDTNAKLADAAQTLKNFRTESTKLNEETQILNAVINKAAFQLNGMTKAESGSEKYLELLNLEIEKLSNSYSKQILANKLSADSAAQRVLNQASLLDSETDVIEAENMVYDECIQYANTIALARSMKEKLIQSERKADEETGATVKIIEDKYGAELSAIRRRVQLTEAENNLFGNTENLNNITVDNVAIMLKSIEIKSKIIKSEKDLEEENQAAIENIKLSYGADINATKRKIAYAQALDRAISETEINEKVTQELNLESQNLKNSLREARSKFKNIDLVVGNEKQKIESDLLNNLTNRLGTGRALEELGIGQNLQAQAESRVVSSQLRGRKPEDVSPAEMSDILSGKTRTISQNLGIQSAALIDEAQTFQQIIGNQTPKLFADGMAEAMGAVLNQADNLRDVLDGIAMNFLKTLQQAFLTQASNKIVAAVLPKAASGGYVKKYADGGLVSGGSGIKDDVPAMLKAGEYVIRKSSVEKYGASNLQNLNLGEAPKFADGGFFLPGVRGGKEISGYKDLTAFAQQTTTSGATDTLIGGRSTAFASLEDQSKKLSAYALLNEQDIINEEIRNAQESALNMIKEREAYRTAKRKAFQQQLVGTAVGAAVSFGAGYLGQKSNFRLKNPKIPYVREGNVKIGEMRYVPDQTESSEEGPSYWGKKAYGGIIKEYRNGGSPTDKVPALLMDGEYVMSQKATRKYGKQFFDSINQGRAPRFADGGQVSTSEPSFAEKAAAMSDSKTTGATNVSININVTGQTSQMQTEGDPKQKGTDYKEMSKQIEQIVLKTIAEQKRAGGMLKPNR